MSRKLLHAVLFAVWSAAPAAAVLLVAAVVGGDEPPAEGKAPDVNALMVKCFRPGGYRQTVLDAVKAEKWDDAAKLAKEWGELGATLGRAKAAKGEPKSWEALSKKFAENTKAVADAAEKKDAKAVSAALGALGLSCGNCHKLHKP